MVDIGGQSKFSIIVRVFTGTADGTDVLVTPNPVIGNYFVVGGQFSKIEKVTLRLIDMNGRIILTQDEQTKTGFNSFKINCPAGARNGIYLVELITGDKKRITKLVITR